jgi:hypothetical protein
VVFTPAPARANACAPPRRGPASKILYEQPTIYARARFFSTLILPENLCAVAYRSGTEVSEGAGAAARGRRPA